MHGTRSSTWKDYLLKHTSRVTKARTVKIQHRVNVNTLAHEPASHLQMNDIASVEIETNLPIFLDAYSQNRITGSFILIDPMSNATVAAGMIQKPLDSKDSPRLSKDFSPQASDAAGVSSQERHARHGHEPAVFLLEDRPSLATRLERALFDNGMEVLHLGGARRFRGSVCGSG